MELLAKELVDRIPLKIAFINDNAFVPVNNGDSVMQIDRLGEKPSRVDEEKKPRLTV